VTGDGDTKTDTLPRKPGLRLGSRGLTLLLGSVLLCPIVAVLVLAAILPKAHDKPLAVTANVVHPMGTEPALAVRNVGETELRSMRLELNEAYAYLPQARLAAGAEVQVPLSWFAKKTGQHFEPDKTDVRAVHISARLPGNERALFRQTVENAP